MKMWIGEKFNPKIIKSPMTKMTPKEIERKYEPEIKNSSKD